MVKVASARAGRQRNWITAFRRSAFGRAVIRRLPSRSKRWLRIGRRWQRSVFARVRLRWHRSLQLRVVSTTLVLSVLVIAVLGGMRHPERSVDCGGGCVRAGQSNVVGDARRSQPRLLRYPGDLSPPGVGVDVGKVHKTVWSVQHDPS